MTSNGDIRKTLRDCVTDIIKIDQMLSALVKEGREGTASFYAASIRDELLETMVSIRVTMQPFKNNNGENDE